MIKNKYYIIQQKTIKIYKWKNWIVDVLFWRMWENTHIIPHREEQVKNWYFFQINPLIFLMLRLMIMIQIKQNKNVKIIF